MHLNNNAQGKEHQTCTAEKRLCFYSFKQNYLKQEYIFLFQISCTVKWSTIDLIHLEQKHLMVWLLLLNSGYVWWLLLGIGQNKCIFLEGDIVFLLYGTFSNGMFSDWDV